MTMFNHTETSGQRRQSPHSGEQLLQHPTYSLDLVSLDYHIFSLMKESLRGKYYASDEEVKTPVMKWIKEQSVVFYEAGIHALI